MDIDSIYVTFKDGSILTDMPPCELSSHEEGFMYLIAGFVIEINFDKIYSIGKITEEGCEVLWCVKDIPRNIEKSCDICGVSYPRSCVKCAPFYGELPFFKPKKERIKP